jgi:hypothetical protein
MNLPLSFEEKSLLGGWHIDVLFGKFVIGTIREIPSIPGYGHFHGPHNILTPRLEDRNLENLKKRIEASVKPGAQF